jgi:hypothetical protein
MMMPNPPVPVPLLATSPSQQKTPPNPIGANSYANNANANVNDRPIIVEMQPVARVPVNSASNPSSLAHHHQNLMPTNAASISPLQPVAISSGYSTTRQTPPSFGQQQQHGQQSAMMPIHYFGADCQQQQQQVRQKGINLGENLGKVLPPNSQGRNILS